MKISIKQLEKSNERFKLKLDKKLTKGDAKIDEVNKVIFESERKNIPNEVLKGNIIGDKENLIKRRDLLINTGPEPIKFAYERAIGKNDSVYSNFIHLIMNAKKKVGKINIKKGINVVGYATGFMVSENLFLTNNHVFGEFDDVKDSSVEFNYERDIYGNPTKSITFEFAPSVFFYSFKDLDYCLVAVQPNDITNRYKLSDIGYIYLDPAFGKLGNENVERLNIIHHPMGDYQQLSIRENKFVKILSTSLWYKSDTAQGSSGSPVFNDQWQVVALHHMGVAKTNEDGEYIDKYGKVIPIVDNKIDISRIYWTANEGIRISVIRKHIKSVFPDSPIISELFKKPIKHPDDISENHSESSKHVISGNRDSINISLPTKLIENEKSVNINVSSRNIINKNSKDTVKTKNKKSKVNAKETLKLEKAMDYSSCKGYRSNFLGSKFSIPIPKPKKSIKSQIAKISGRRSYILKYYKFSVIFNQLKRMPIISAVNVDGNPKKRKDFSKRKDNWIRDRRINIDIQLNDKFYKKSGFDKGHMSRREDANWGKNSDEAKRNADLTCVHTNACPQVPKLNRSSSKGLWGKLEKIILEKGAKKENGKTGKITVFNGPIFKDSDPIFRGIKVPMEYFKIILWLTDDNKLKATAFKLAQSDLVKEIDFEAIGIDQNISFKEYQCSIKQLQKETNIDFSKITKFDIFDGDNEIIRVKNENKLLEILSIF